MGDADHLIKVAIPYHTDGRVLRDKFFDVLDGEERKGVKWKNVEMTPLELLNHIKEGGAWSPGYVVSEGSHKEDNIAGAMLVAVDFDNKTKDGKMTTGDKYIPYSRFSDPENRPRGVLFVHTTASHTDEWNRFRAVIQLPHTIQPNQIKRVLSALAKASEADPDAANKNTALFYGAQGCQSEYYGDVMSEANLKRLLEYRDKVEPTQIKATKELSKLKLIPEEEMSKLLSYVPCDGQSYDDWFRDVCAVTHHYGAEHKDIAVRVLEGWTFDSKQGLDYKVHNILKSNGSIKTASIKGLISRAMYHGYGMQDDERLSPNKFKPKRENDTQFWEAIKQGKGYVPSLRPYSMYQYLMSKGVCWITINDSNDSRQLVRIEDYVIEPINDKVPAQLIFERIKAIPEEEFEFITKEEMLNYTIKNINNYFSEKQMQILDEVKPDWLKDTPDSSFVCYRNCWVEVKKGFVIIDRPYSELRKHIWKSSIRDRDFDNILRDQRVDKHQRGQFEKFMEYTCTERNDDDSLQLDEARYKSLRSSYGYMLHRYKDPTYAKILVLSESNLEENPDGRTGKSLITEGLKQFRTLCSFDGKSFDPDSQFAFAKVQDDTDIVRIDDIPRGFPYEMLFSRTTGDFDIEKKFMNQTSRKFGDAPKMVLTTNFPPKGTTGSYLARRHEMELLLFFRDADGCRPVDYCGGQRFFGQDWSAEEWNKFDCYSLLCLSEFLDKLRIPEYESKYRTERALVHNVGLELTAIFDELERGKFIPTATIMQKYEESSGDKRKQHPRIIMARLQDYCKVKNITFEKARQRVNGVTLAGVYLHDPEAGRGLF